MIKSIFPPFFLFVADMVLYCHLIPQQVFPACAQSFPTIGMPSSDMINPAAYLQFNSAAQQLVSCCGGLINNMGIIAPDVGLRRNISSSTPVSLPETFLDSSCFTVGFPLWNVHVLVISVSIIIDILITMCTVAAYPILLNLGRWLPKPPPQCGFWSRTNNNNSILSFSAIYR